MSKEKIKQMVSSVVKGGDTLDPTKIAKDINKRYKEHITVQQVQDFLQSEFYPEIEHLEERHKGFEGRFYI